MNSYKFDFIVKIFFLRSTNLYKIQKESSSDQFFLKIAVCGSSHKLSLEILLRKLKICFIKIF
ncbi:hypothetical protein LEP1GSC170_4325 [Leptospira interrogans serovar Bataviae str. HAI135]|uniref:Uncharacterized protein n=1 Tax=Leptospira noguchii str. 2001034031 TaxID=1193053 RepID=M6YCV8_9LEPT|nr:hypothetical protein LEP1GSC170_4325 [Leptospira interrogans serovar Bataviae str. HAI135]EMO87474.1 hypothetical protein LEP1GSC024_0942 [Leptospira noguchii str. 2001034031]